MDSSFCSSDSTIKKISYHQLKQYFANNECKKNGHHWHYLINGKEISSDSCFILLRHCTSSSKEIERATQIDDRASTNAAVTGLPAILCFFVLSFSQNAPPNTITNDIFYIGAADAILAMGVYMFSRIGYGKHIKKAIALYNDEILKRQIAGK